MMFGHLTCCYRQSPMEETKNTAFFQSDDSNPTQNQDQQLPQELLNEIDLVLGEAVDKFEPHDFEPSSFEIVHEPQQDYGLQEMQNTLLDLVSHNLSPLSRYVKAFTLGASYETVLDLCDLIISPILPRLQDAELHQHHDELTFFKSVLHFAKSESDLKGREVMKNVVYRSFKELQKKFHLTYRGSKVAVKNLIAFLDALKANQDISDDVIQQFFAIGVPSLTWVRKTSSEELTSLSGIPIETIRKIRLLAKEQKSKKPSMASSYRIAAPESKKSYDINELDLQDPFVIRVEDDEPEKIY